MDDVYATNEVMEEEFITTSEEEFPKKDRASAAKKRKDDYRKAVNRKKLCDAKNWDSMHDKGLHQLVKENLTNRKDSVRDSKKYQNHRRKLIIEREVESSQLEEPSFD